MSGSWFPVPLTALVGLTVAMLAAGCTAVPSSSFDPDSPSPAASDIPVVVTASAVTATPLATATPDLTQEPAMTPAPTVAGIDSPPEALLAVEGGDPVMGQLGTNTWKNGGSDAPWLRGAPITVGAGEPLTVTFLPGIDVASWRTRYVPAASDGQTGGASLGEGVGQPTFQAPAAGSWTVAVTVTFHEENGRADYYWRLDVQ